MEVKDSSRTECFLAKNDPVPICASSKPGSRDPGSATILLDGFDQTHAPPLASISSSIKWEKGVWTGDVCVP